MKEIFQKLMSTTECCSCSIIECSAILLIAFGLLYFLLKSKKLCLAKNDDGSVLLTKSALRRVVQNVAHEIGIQGKIRSKVCHCCSKFVVDVVIQVGNWQSVSEISNILQERLKEVFMTNLGLTDPVKINITVSNFLFKKNVSSCTCQQSTAEGNHCCTENEDNGRCYCVSDIDDER